MVAKKKAPKKTKKKIVPKKKVAVTKKAAKKAAPPAKPAAKAKPVAAKLTAAKKSASPVKVAPKKAAAKPPKKATTNSRGKAEFTGPETFSSQDKYRSAGQSGGLQGLSDSATADSESVDELLEEGNALEAEVVQGVEDAPEPDEGEVHTREVPEDDVPEEYREEDDQ
jgi:hypothetical protein